MKLDTLELYQKRIKEYTQEVFKYRRAFANDGLLFTIVVLFIVAGIYYNQMIELIPEQFPVPLALAIGLALVLTIGKHRTFLKEADMLFLPTIERSMEQYFGKALRYNLVFQCIGIFVLLVMLKPLYDAKIPVEDQNLLFFYLIPVLAKGWNLYSSWNMLRVPYPEKRLIHSLLRYLFNFILLYWFFSGGTLLTYQGTVLGGIILGLCLIVFYAYERNVCKKHTYQWIYLLEMEKKLVARFYGIINMFVDVPHVAKKVKERKWTSWITTFVPFQKKQAYQYLLLKTFLRTEEYSSRFIRLSIVGLILIWSLPNIYVKLAIGAGFVYITRSQIKGMRNYHERQFWQGVFPWPSHLLQSSFRKLSIGLMAVQSVIFLLVILVSY